MDKCIKKAFLFSRDKIRERELKIPTIILRPDKYNNKAVAHMPDKFVIQILNRSLTDPANPKLTGNLWQGSSLFPGVSNGIVCKRY